MAYNRIEFPTHRTEFTCLPSAFPCMWGHVNAFVYERTSKVSGLASFCTGIWVLFSWRAEFYSVEQILWYRTESGAPYFICFGSFVINIRRDPTCIPLTLEGLSKATTCTPHRICSSMWMTCVNAMPVYGHACKRIGRIRWSQKQGSIWFPRALCEWIGPHGQSNHMIIRRKTKTEWLKKQRNAQGIALRLFLEISPALSPPF